MTAATLKARTLKDLAALAKRAGVPNWNSLRKEELVKALLRNQTTANNAKTAPTKASKALVAKSTSAKNTPTKVPVGKSTTASKNISRPLNVNGKTESKKSGGKQPSKVVPAFANKVATFSAKPTVSKQPTAQQKPVNEQKKRILKKLEEIRTKEWATKNLAAGTSTTAEAPVSKPLPLKGNWPNKDRLVVMVRGPYWLHANWNVTPAGVQRAQAALAQDWHLAKPILRVINITSSGSSTSSERIVREIPIHGGVKNWFIDVNNPPQSYRVEIGYISTKGRFFCMARSNTVTTPPAQTGDSLDTHWADIALDAEKIYALSGGNGEAVSDLQDLFAERLQKPLTGITVAAPQEQENDVMEQRSKNFKLEVEAEVILRGVAAPGSSVMVHGEPIRLHPDGTFSVSMDFPNRRQVIPIVANSKDGALQRTVVLAVERNTKTMEAHPRDAAQE